MKLQPVQLALDTQKRGNAHDQQVQDFLQRDDWRSALKYIERLQKKNPSVRLQVNHCLITFLTEDIPRVNKAWHILRDVVEKSTPIVDMEILNAIDKSLPSNPPEEFIPKDFLPNMWKRAADASPKDKQILDAWFESCCAKYNFVQASTVALRGSKTFDKKYTYHWRAITCRYLDSQMGDSQTRALSGRMALALLEQSLKATQLTGSTNGIDSTAKPGKKSIQFNSIGVQSSTDMRLAIRIYELHKPATALSLLQEWASLGNWELALERIRILTTLCNYEDLWKFSYQLLCEAAGTDSQQNGIGPYSFGKTSDDMAVWNAATISCHQLADSAVLAKLKDLLSHPALQKRHRALAGIDLSLKFEKDNRGITNPLLPAAAISLYLEHFNGALVAYGDLKSFATRLDDEMKDHLISTLSTSKRPTDPLEDEINLKTWLLAELNELKFTYTFRISHPSNSHKVSQMERFMENCLELYSLSLVLEKEMTVTERRTGDEAAILAACTLIHMYKAGISEAQLQATLVLEKLLLHSKHHYGAILMLIRLYVRQGVFSKAYQHYQRLDLKNIQLFTESWILLDRISSIFPDEESVGHLLTKHARYMEAKQTSSQHLIELYRDKDNHLGLIDVYEFLNTAENSISKANILANLANFEMHNTHGEGPSRDSVMYHRLSLFPGSWDKSDHHLEDIHSSIAFPNYEHPAGSSMERLIDVGPPISMFWMACEQVLLWLRRWLFERTALPQVGTYYLTTIAHLTEDIAVLENAILHDREKDRLTRAELLAAWTTMQMYRVTLSASLTRTTYPTSRQQSDVDLWVGSHLTQYQHVVSECLKALSRGNLEVLFKSRDFVASPVSTFDRSQWSTLHTYYKLTQIFRMFPPLLADMIKDASMFKEMAKGSSMSKQNWESLDAAVLEEHLSEWVWNADASAHNYHEGVKVISAHWNDKENRKNLVRGIRGNAGLLSRLLEEDWTSKKCDEISLAWLDCCEGVELENPEYWWREHWMDHLSSINFKDKNES